MDSFLLDRIVKNVNQSSEGKFSNTVLLFTMPNKLLQKKKKKMKKSSKVKSEREGDEEQEGLFFGYGG